MGTIEFTVPDKVEKQFRQWAMMRFGHRQEPIEKAGQETILTWIVEQSSDSKITPSRSPLLTKRGRLSHVDRGSVELQESVGELLMEQHRH